MTTKHLMPIIELLFPRVCLSCRSLWSYLCFECKKKLIPHPEICPITHEPSPGYAVRNDILTQASPLDGCIVLFRFNSCIKTLITKLKYSHYADIAEFLAQRLAFALQSHSIIHKIVNQDSLVVSYVPSHWYRHYFIKGYNQSQLLAQSLVKQLSTWSFQSLCKKTRHTHSQVGLSKAQRKNNISDSFVLQREIPVWSVVIIVDDVLTTWSTLIEIAKTIKQSQPNCQVWGLCVARNG